MTKQMLMAATALGLFAASAMAEDAVMVSSTVPDHKPGMVIPEDKVFAVPRGASATLLFRSGAVVRIKGPYEAPLKRPNANSATMLVQNLKSEGVDASVLGATRSAPKAASGQSAGRLVIEPQRSGIYCVQANDSVWLRHPTSTAATSERMRLRMGGITREVAWGKDVAEIEWPGDVKIEDGDRFETLNGKGEPVGTIVFRRLAQPASATAWIAESMLLGCESQAAPALAELAKQVNSNTD